MSGTHRLAAGIIYGAGLPWAIDRKYPHSAKEWRWFWVFPSHRLSVDPPCRKIRRHHLYPSTLQKAFCKATQESGITKRAKIHSNKLGVISPLERI